MRGFVLALALAAAAAVAAQEAADPDVATCAQFTAMDNEARVGLLSRLAIGDEIDAADNDAAVGFAADVAARCRARRTGGWPRWRRRLSAATSGPPGRSGDVRGLRRSFANGMRMERVWNPYCT